MLTRKPAFALLICLGATSFSSMAQEPSSWRSLPWTQDLTFDEVKAAYEAERDALEATDSTSTQTGTENEQGEEGPEENIAFQRFEYFWRSRVNTDDTDKVGKLQNYINQLKSLNGTDPLCTQNLNPADWQLLGPRSYSSGSTVNHSMGIVVALWADPAEEPLTHVLAGTNSSGLWRGTLGPDGWSWSCLTDNLRMPGMGVASIAVNTNGDIYIGTTVGYGGGYAAGLWRFGAQDQEWVNLQDFPPTALAPGVNEIKFIGNYCFVVKSKQVMRAPRNVDLSAAGVFTELVIQDAPTPYSAVQYLEITGFTVPAGDGLILCSKGDNGADGGGKIYRSFDAGDNWENVSSQFPPNTTYLEIRETGTLIGDVDNSDPNQWHMVGNPTFSYVINIFPETGNITKRFAILNIDNSTPPGQIYRFRFGCEKAEAATVRAYLIYSEMGQPIDMTGAQLVMDVSEGTEIQYDAVFEANAHYNKIVIEASFPADYDPNSIPAGVTLVPIETLPAEPHPIVAAISPIAFGHARCSVVNTPNNDPNNGIYICVLDPGTTSSSYTVYRSVEGTTFSPLFNSNGLGHGFDKNKGVFKVTSNGTMYIGGIELYYYLPPVYIATPITTGHGDMRALLPVYEERSPGQEVVLVGDDGGVALTTNGGTSGVTFHDINGSHFPITQFYGMGMDEHERLLVGGTQDNQSWKYSPSTQDWTKFDGGDGGRSRSYTNKDGTKWATVNINNESTILAVGGDNDPSCLHHHTHTDVVLGNPAELYVDLNTDEAKCYLGHGDLYRISCNDPVAVNLTADLTDFQLLPDFPPEDPKKNTVWAIGVHELDDNVIFFGGRVPKWSTNSHVALGRLYRTNVGGATWTDIGSNITDDAVLQPFDWFALTTIVVDPDVKVMQLERNAAAVRL